MSANTQMNQDVREELDRIEGRITSLAEASSESRSWKVLWKMLMVMTGIAQVAVVSIIIPFGTWTVRHITDLEREQAGMNQWMNIGPRFTATDADKLRLQTKDEMRKEISEQLILLLTKMDRMSSEVSSLKDALHDHTVQSERNGK